MAICAAALPASVLGLLAPEEWQVDVLRLCFLSAAGLAAVHDWVETRGGDTVRRWRRWTGSGLVLGAGFLLSGRPSLLLFCVSALIAGALSLGAERAHVASEELRLRLESQARRREA